MASTLSLSIAPRIASPVSSRRPLRQSARLQSLQLRRGVVCVRAEESSSSGTGLPATEEGRIKRTAELEEKFAILDSGKWSCNSCGYVYDQFKGDSNYPVPPGIEFKKLPEDWLCPTCGAAPTGFSSLSREVAGFAQNQSYGLGVNAMTSGQKSGLIWGSLAFFFSMFMAGYFLN